VALEDNRQTKANIPPNRLTKHLVEKALNLEEFANGGVQCHVRLKDSSIHPGVLISNATAAIAMRGQSALPFQINDIAELYQTDEDCSPQQCGNWQFFNEWQV